jgi:hypothetical protein
MLAALSSGKCIRYLSHIKEMMKMSVPNYVDHLVRQEQYKDLLREAQQQRIVRVLAPRSGHHYAVAGWRGALMTTWSSTLKDFVSASSPRGAWRETGDIQARLSPDRMANRHH